MNPLLVLVLLALAAGPSFAQSPQPYAGLEGRPIKALSEQQIADLRAGRGMGLALAAELNGYPGPMHVLELADALDLSGQQRAKMQELFAARRRRFPQEAELDKAFADKTIAAATLAASTKAIGVACLTAENILTTVKDGEPFGANQWPILNAGPGETVTLRQAKKSLDAFQSQSAKDQVLLEAKSYQ
jgi:hypothetical protein